jgi:hypothetical protein
MWACVDRIPKISPQIPHSWLILMGYTYRLGSTAFHNWYSVAEVPFLVRWDRLDREKNSAVGYSRDECNKFPLVGWDNAETDDRR